ncbi:MAG: protein kinase domain-containing protein [Chthoniobacterales bacterium]
MKSPPGGNDCLRCLLQAGIDPGEEEEGLAPNESGARVYQHYEILNHPGGSLWELGRGTMGITYKARDINLDTPVALKIISARFSGRPNARRRFLYEARAAACLRHPNVASVFHFGTIHALPTLEDGVATAEENADAGDCFYAMELVEGETLETRLRRSGPLAPVLALEIGLQVAKALAAAERRGLVHRDLKPSNIMLAEKEEKAAVAGSRPGTDEAWVKVIDFGLAKLRDKQEQPTTSFLGTLAFASPEQIGAREVDVRSDIYSLGATLWYCLTGKTPFPGRLPNDLRAPGNSAPLPVAQLAERGVPAAVIALLESALAPNPNDRPHSAAEFVQSTQNLLDDLVGAARQVTSPRSRAWKWALAGGGLGLAAGLVGLAVFLTLSTSPKDKSIAVLPFRNLSNGPADEYFVEGIQDDIVFRLVKVHDLRVISREGAARYPANAPRDLHEIGRTLGVRHVLEGSLRRSGDHLLLQVALIDTVDGHELWAEGYDRKLADTMNLQGELASDIAEALDARLSPQESAGVQASSTHNADAFVLYLRGRKFENSPTFAISDYEAAEVLYRQAIALDPSFALAHARLAYVLGLLYRYRGPSEELKQRAYAEVSAALRVQPDLAEAHLNNALCSYLIDRDFNRAMPELQKARHLLPNDTKAQSYIAYIQRRRGHWREARARLEDCLKRDPGNVMYQEELYTTAYLLRDWPTAEQNALRAEALGPEQPLLKVQRAMVDLWKDGNIAPLQRVFAAIPSYGDKEGIVAWMRWDAAMIARDFAAARAAVNGFPFETLPSVYSAPVPKSYLEGCIALAAGDDAGAPQKFEAARPVMEAEALAHPESAQSHARLGLLYAYMGRKADAIREGERAVRLKPIAVDAVDGPEETCNLALIHARLGDNDQAISMIESLLRAPGGVFFYEASMSLWELRLRWQWDPLRSDPRFQKILAASEPPTVF